MPQHPDHPQVALGRVRGAGWVRVCRGVHRRADADDPARATLLAWQCVLPARAAFSAFTAAELRGWDLPRVPRGGPVCVAMPEGCTAPTAPGLRVTRHRDPPAYDLIDGLRVTTAAETVLTCAPLLGVLDLVVLLDSALRAGDVELLELRMLAGRRRRGVRTLRRSLVLVDAGTESVMETLLRVLLTVCGHDVRSQHEIHDDGLLVARADLWLVGTRTLPEYDGDCHGEPGQRRRDRRRDRHLHRIGWTRHGYTDDEVLLRGVGILADADRAVGREHDPRRIRAWTTLLRESTFTGAGRAALARRLG